MSVLKKMFLNVLKNLLMLCEELGGGRDKKLFSFIGGVQISVFFFFCFFSFLLSVLICVFAPIFVHHKVVLSTFERKVETENQLLTVGNMLFACTGTLKMIYLNLCLYFS